MSHQGYEGWFPECIVCKCGKLGPVICLSPLCHDDWGKKKVVLEKTVYVEGNLSIDVKLVKEDGHFWKCCQLCDARLLADGGAFGSYALCIKCFNETLDVVPPPWLYRL